MAALGEWRGRMERHAVAVRVVPFVIFILLTALQGRLGPNSEYWVYLAKTLAGACMVWAVWPLARELSWRSGWEGPVAGVLVFVMWVGIDPLYPKLGGAPATVWNPFESFGAGMAWFFVGVRILGTTLVVPPLEELFFRSFVYRYIVKADFLSVPLSRWHWPAFLVTSVLFGLEHHQWLAGILCGFAYQGLVVWKGRLGDAMVAHAVTNLLLGGWVVWRGDWQFW